MNDQKRNDDHSQPTHSAKCDEVGCTYLARVHAHNLDEAAVVLAHNLAQHNEEVHRKKTDPVAIVEAVRAKTVEV